MSQSNHPRPPLFLPGRFTGKRHEPNGQIVHTGYRYYRDAHSHWDAATGKSQLFNLADQLHQSSDHEVDAFMRRLTRGSKSV